MPRTAKPYLERDWFVTRAGGEYKRLCHRSEGMTKAKALLREHLKQREQQRELTGGAILPRLTVKELFALFLQAVDAEKSPHTLADYQRWCAAFAELHGDRPARDIGRYDANEFRQKLLTTTWKRNKQPAQRYKPKTINHAIITLRRAFNWGIDNELLPEGRNPFRRMKLLACEGRQRIATEEEYQTQLHHCTDDHFRDVLIAMRYTAARPQDIRMLTWAMIDWQGQCWVIRKHKTSKTARDPKPHIIGMNNVVTAMLQRRQSEQGNEGFVFLNRKGRAWKRNALGLRMRRLRKRAGIRPDENGEEFVLYTNRHTFLTQAGMDPTIPAPVLQDIAGHTSIVTTQRYIHARAKAAAEASRRVADSLPAPSLQAG